VNGKVIWLTGLSGSGKTTLGIKIVDALKKMSQPVVFLDGDVVRDFFEHDLGYERRDRILNVRRIAFAARLLAEQNVNVVVANIAPYFEVRDFIRRKLGEDYLQIYLQSSVEQVAARDVKGHYKNQQSGQLNNLVGIDDVYEVPRHPDLVVDTANISVEESLEKILVFLKQRNLLK